MKKISILRRKIIRNYNKKDNWVYSEFKGYKKGTYFGYDSIESLLKSTIKEFQDFYGPTLKKWRY